MLPPLPPPDHEPPAWWQRRTWPISHGWLYGTGAAASVVVLGSAWTGRGPYAQLIEWQVAELDAALQYSTALVLWALLWRLAVEVLLLAGITRSNDTPGRQRKARWDHVFAWWSTSRRRLGVAACAWGLAGVVYLDSRSVADPVPCTLADIRAGCGRHVELDDSVLPLLDEAVSVRRETESRTTTVPLTSTAGAPGARSVFLRTQHKLPTNPPLTGVVARFSLDGADRHALALRGVAVADETWVVDADDSPLARSMATGVLGAVGVIALLGAGWARTRELEETAG